MTLMGHGTFISNKIYFVLINFNYLLERRKKVSKNDRHTGIPGLWTQELDAGLWTLNAGLWTLDSGRWILDVSLITQTTI